MTMNTTNSFHGLVALPLQADETGPRRGIVFSDVSKESGVRFKMTAGKDPSTQLLEVKGSGVAMVDYDNDGDLDLFFANGATLDGALTAASLVASGQTITADSFEAGTVGATTIQGDGLDLNIDGDVNTNNLNLLDPDNDGSAILFLGTTRAMAAHSFNG